MSTILLSDEEYDDIQALLKAATSKIATASPRASTHYKTLAKLHANFLAQEDGKRALRERKLARMAEIEQQTQARRAEALQKAQVRIQSQPASSSSTGRKEKSA
jgi:hypothetical protein